MVALGNIEIRVLEDFIVLYMFDKNISFEEKQTFLFVLFDMASNSYDLIIPEEF